MTTLESSFALMRNVHAYDAVALADGQLAVAITTYSNTLQLLFVDETGVTRTTVLDDDTDSFNVAVAVSPQPRVCTSHSTTCRDTS